MSQAVCLFRTPTSLAFGAVSEDVSGGALVSAFPRGGRQGVYHGPVRAQIVGMSQAVCLFRTSTSLAFGADFEADFEDVSSEALVLALPGGGARVQPRARSRPDCGDVSGGLLVCVPNIISVRSSL